jgi:hypothetical protein
MNRDPIVDEIRAIRDDLAKRYNYDIDAIVRALQKASADEGRQLVLLPPHSARLNSSSKFPTTRRISSNSGITPKNVSPRMTL